MSRSSSLFFNSAAKLETKKLNWFDQEKWATSSENTQQQHNHFRNQFFRKESRRVFQKSATSHSHTVYAHTHKHTIYTYRYIYSNIGASRETTHSTHFG